MITDLAPDRHYINPYIMRVNEYAEWIFSEDEATKLNGQWATTFKNQNPVHVEIGTGNGFHFSHYGKENPNVSFVGFEIKYKTLVQSIARALRFGCKNTRMIKADARKMTNYFAPNEVEKIIIHFPDPWPKPRHGANRLMHASFFREAFAVLKDGGTLEFKTDHLEYFKWAAEEVKLSPFKMTYYTEDLHHSEVADQNYVTQFESLFLRKGQAIYYFSLQK